MQVHLAQLEYELTRMRGKGHILSRLGAGVNMRGPGETKLEVDRRVVRQRIQTLRRRIDHMARTRRTQRARRAARRGTADRPRRLHERRQVHAAQRAHRRRRLGARQAVRDARPHVAVVPLSRPRLRAHRHRRLHPQAAALAGRRLRLHPRGDDAGRRHPRGRRRPSRALRRSRCANRPWPRCSTCWARRRRGSLVFNKTDLADPGKLARLRALYPEAEFIAAARGEGLGRAAGAPGRLLRPRPAAGAAAVSRTPPPPTCTACAASPATSTRSTRPEGVIFTARLPVAEAGRYARYSLDTAMVDDRGRRVRRRAGLDRRRDRPTMGESQPMSPEPADVALAGPDGVTVPVKLLGAGGASARARLRARRRLRPARGRGARHRAARPRRRRHRRRPGPAAGPGGPHAAAFGPRCPARHLHRQRARAHRSGVSWRGTRDPPQHRSRRAVPRGRAAIASHSCSFLPLDRGAI